MFFLRFWNLFETNKRKEKGFTLIEALITIVIVAMSILALTWLFLSNSILNKESRDKLTAQKTAQTEIDNLRNSPFQDLMDVAEIQRTTPPSAQTVTSLPSGQLKTYISPIDTNGGGIAWDDEDLDDTKVDENESEDEDEPIFEIKIDVSWANKQGTTKTETIVTYISNNGL